MSAIASRVLHVIRASAAAAGRLLRAVLGNIDWHAPPWLHWLRQRYAQLDAWTRREPRRAAAFAGLIVVVVGGGYLGWRWYESRPKPTLTEFTVTAPAMTCYACEPPGKPNPLVVVFADSVAPLEQAGKDLDSGTRSIRLSRAIAGRWHWNDDRARVSAAGRLAHRPVIRGADGAQQEDRRHSDVQPSRRGSGAGETHPAHAVQQDHRHE